MGRVELRPVEHMGGNMPSRFALESEYERGEEMFQSWRVKTWEEEPPRCTSGTAWSVESILDPQHDISSDQPKIALLMTPSEVESPQDDPLLWDTHLWLGGD